MENFHRPRLWVLVADGERARIVAPDKASGRFVTVLPLGIAEHPHYPPALRSGPHGGEGRAQFGADVARTLNYEAERNGFDRLVLVAPVHVLHAVRDALSRGAAARLVGTVAKDLTRLNDHDLSDHLSDWALAPAEPEDV